MKSINSFTWGKKLDAVINDNLWDKLSLDSNIPRNKILHSILPYKSQFSWQELNCFYRPFAIALRSLEKEYHDLFLMLSSFYHAFLLDKLYYRAKYNDKHPFFAYFNKELSKIFSCKIEKVSFENAIDMHRKVIKYINKEKIVIIPGDLHKLTYSELYKTEHQSHFFLIKGYDIDKEIYYILDNSHINREAKTDYGDFVLDFKNTYDLVNSFSLFLNPKEQDMYFWVINRDKGEHKRYTEMAIKFLAYILDEIQNDKKEIVFVEEFLMENIETISKNDLMECSTLINFRNVFYKSYINVIKRIRLNNILLEHLEPEIGGLQILECKNRNLFFYYIMKKHKKDQFEMKVLIDNIVLKEKKLLDIIRKNSHVKELVYEKTKLESHIIINNKNIENKWVGKTLYIYHNREINDTWTYHDDALQILYPVIESECCFSAKFESNANKFSRFQCGIIIRFINDEKILFGNIGNTSIGIYNPQLKENSEILLLDRSEIDLIKLSIAVEKEKIRFYILKGKDREEIFKYKRDNEIKYIGVFSRTWDKIKHNVAISEIEFLK